MTVRQRRFTMIVLLITGVSAATAFALQAFQENIIFFYSPSEVVAGTVPLDTSVRIGGIVVDDSVQRESGTLNVTFTLTDKAETVTVVYDEILPDLFREGQGIVAIGKLTPNNVLIASDVLAKHDEEYMPPAVADALAKAKAGAGNTL